MEIIIGLDPGSRFTGFGALAAEGSRLRHLGHGVIEIPEALPFSEKLLLLSDRLDSLLRRLEPQVTVVEKIFLGKNADSAFKLGQVRGVCMLTAAKARSRVVEYAARSVKKIVTGSGAASKEHVGLIVNQMLGIKTMARVDATDALALAICHAREAEREVLMRKMEMGAR